MAECPYCGGPLAPFIAPRDLSMTMFEWCQWCNRVYVMNGGDHGKAEPVQYGTMSIAGGSRHMI